MTRPTPPFRADHVGSLLRPKAIQAARKLAYQDNVDALLGLDIADPGGRDRRRGADRGGLQEVATIAGTAARCRDAIGRSALGLLVVLHGEDSSLVLRPSRTAR